LLSPINPADINVVEGVYPSKPSLVSCLATSGKGSPEEPVFIGGNEGLAEVVRIGDGVTGLQEGDWVIMKKQQAGTWCTEKNVQVDDVLRLPDAQHLTQVQAATITVCI
jgi:trans-2-enoyl-CoA reductase